MRPIFGERVSEMRWENKLTEIFCISCALFRTTGQGSSLGPDQHEHGSHAAKGNADAQSHQGNKSKRRRINRVETINLPVRQGHVYPRAQRVKTCPLVRKVYC